MLSITKKLLKFANKFLSLVSPKTKKTSRATLRYTNSYGDCLSARLQLHEFVIVDEEMVMDDVLGDIHMLFKESLVADVWRMYLEVLFDETAFSIHYDRLYLERLFVEPEEPLHLDRLFVEPTPKKAPQVYFSWSNPRRSAPQKLKAPKKRAKREVFVEPITRPRCLSVRLGEFDEEKMKAFFARTEF